MSGVNSSMTNVNTPSTGPTDVITGTGTGLPSATGVSQGVTGAQATTRSSAGIRNP